jgi:hypothetical protein
MDVPALLAAVQRDGDVFKSFVGEDAGTSGGGRREA